MTLSRELTFYAALMACCLIMVSGALDSCGGAGLKYLSGDALSAGQSACLGPDDTPYPSVAIERMLTAEKRRGGRSMSNLVNPFDTQRMLLQYHEAVNYGTPISPAFRQDRSMVQTAAQQPDMAGPGAATVAQQRANCREGSGPGNRLCRTRYNTTAPMYGVSLTSGQPVTIVQKFPDLLQQVIFEVCDTSECDVVQGECVQTYVPYLFLVIPLGPVTLTGQDYVLVENGCVCRPKYARGNFQQNSQSQSPASPSDTSGLSDVLPGFSAMPSKK